MIPDLLAGQLEQASYLAELRPHADVYGPIDSRLKADFVRNIGNLERLRAEAEIHLWPHLHGEWIPRLEREPKFEKEFNRLLSNALRKARFGNLLGRSTQIAMVGVGAGLAPAMNHVGDAAAAVLSGAGVGVSIAAGRLTASQDEPTRSLVAFYQSFSTSQVASGVSPK